MNVLLRSLAYLLFGGVVVTAIALAVCVVLDITDTSEEDAW